MASTTGTGKFTFRHRPIDMPERMREHITGAHGAFAPDREASGGDGSTWFSLKNVGLLRLDPGLTGIEVVGGDPRIVAANVHGACLFRHEGTTYLGLPSNEAEAVWLTDTAGRVIRTFASPYGPGGAPFKVCDVEVVDGLLYAANGYADNVCFTCDPFRGAPDDPSVGTWEPLRFGGEGTEHGRFATAHGVTRVPGTNVFTVADRKNARLESYAPGGRYVAGLTLPPGTMPCNVDYFERFALVACLRGPGGSMPAPIYVFEDGNLVSEINIGQDLGLDGFTHIHNAVFRVIDGSDGSRRFFILAYAWNPGNFAILEQVS
jgi:hypothetical protein